MPTYICFERRTLAIGSRHVIVWHYMYISYCPWSPNEFNFTLIAESNEEEEEEEEEEEQI